MGLPAVGAVGRRVTWLLVPLAFAAMAAQDVLCVLLVRAEAQGRAHAAARWDTLQDACGLASLAAVGSSLLLGTDIPLSAAVLAARLAGDYGGTYAGVMFGVWLDEKRPPRPQDRRERDL
jgi:uncharacterized membrane protein YeiH